MTISCSVPPTADFATTRGRAHAHAAVKEAARVQTIEEALACKIPHHRNLVKMLRRTHGDVEIGTCTVKQAYGGMRGVTSMTYETSDVDPYNGVRIRDLPILECLKLLPKPSGCDHPYAEGMLWLLLTGEVPSDVQVAAFREELAAFAHVPDSVFRVIDALPLQLHPMAQLSAALLAMQTQSRLQEAYQRGVPREDLWKSTLHDVLTVIVQQPIIASYIYHRITGSERAGVRPTVDLPRLDMAANFAAMMGFPHNDMAAELFRLHLSTHMDHGGGSASCFSVRVVGSTLSDPFLAWSAGVNGLAGPLHGRANEEVMRFVLSLRDSLHGRHPTRANIAAFVNDVLQAGRVIPGYGHTTLLATDPRFFLQREFARRFMPGDDLCQLVQGLFDVVPAILKNTGKVRNPWPNVDAHSGVLWYRCGVRALDFHTVLFATSRVMGPLSNLVWDRVVGLPVVRPMSVTSRWMKARCDGDDQYVEPGLPKLP